MLRKVGYCSPPQKLAIKFYIFYIIGNITTHISPQMIFNKKQLYASTGHHPIPVGRSGQ